MIRPASGATPQMKPTCTKLRVELCRDLVEEHGQRHRRHAHDQRMGERGQGEHIPFVATAGQRGAAAGVSMWAGVVTAAPSGGEDNE